MKLARALLLTVISLAALPALSQTSITNITARTAMASGDYLNFYWLSNSTTLVNRRITFPNFSNAVASALWTANAANTTYTTGVSNQVYNLVIGANSNNVITYGAIPNDGLDDSTAIQLAINVICTNGGGTVYFPAGTYHINGTPRRAGWTSEGHDSAIVVWTNGVALVGDSMDGTILKALTNGWGAALNFLGGGGSNAYTGGVEYGLTNFAVKDMTLDHDGMSGIDMTQIYNSKNILFERAKFKNEVLYDAIDPNFGPGPVWVIDCRFENIGGNVISVQSEKIFMRGCTVTGCGYANIAAGGGVIQQGASSTAWISDCEFNDVGSLFGGGATSQSAAPGVTYISDCSFAFTNSALTNFCNDNAYIDVSHSYFSSGNTNINTAMIAVRSNGISVFRDCFFAGDRTAFFLDRPTEFKLFNSRLVTTGKGITARGPAGAGGYEVRGNYFNTSGSATGIRLDSAAAAHSFTISGNTFKSVTQGILITDASTNHLIQGNTFVSHGNEAIYLQGNVTSGTRIVGNDFQQSGNNLDIYEAGVTVMGNTLKGYVTFNASGYTNVFFGNTYSNIHGTLTAVRQSGNISDFAFGVIVVTPDTLTDAATIATDASLGNHFRVTLGGNRTLGNPTNPADGQRATWEVIQDATGSRTLTMDTKFAFGTDIATPITLTTTASKRDFITAIYNSTADKWYVVGFVRGY